MGIENKCRKNVTSLISKNYFIAFSFVFIILVSISFVSADGTVASWTRAYCRYNAGSGGYACDSGSVGGNYASCSAANGAQCAEEGDVYCYAQSYCEVQGYTNQGPTNAYNVNWDSDSADCSCKVGAGRWNLGGEVSATSCCGDDSGEYKIARVCSSGCTSDASDDACCSESTKCVYSSTCYSNNACNGALKCNAGAWVDHCSDGIQDCDETGVDCGGANCITCAKVNAVYWTDMIGRKITQADVNDYVMMVAETSGAEDMLINFNVFEAGVTSCYSENYSASSISNKASVVWKVKVCGDGSSDGNKFKAFLSALPALYNESSLLTVSLTENDSLPVAIISSPLEGSMFNVGENVNFISGSYDIDDLLTSYEWNFDVYGTGETSNLANATHSYSSGGPRFITLTVQNSRGKIASTITGILINSTADDPPLAIISEPKYGERFSGMLITFNATRSRDDITPFSQLIFTWQFDDGSSYSAKGMSGAYFTKLFSTAGEHTVKLSVDDSEPVSETETLFYIKGCQIPLDGGYEFVPLKSCSSVSKHYFCTDNETLYYDTMKEHCEGADNQPLTADDCCPRGFYCPNAGAACTERPSACESFNASQEECESYGCIWLNGTCADPAGMSSCSDYGSEEACNSDILGLGKPVGRGLGTDICGRTFGGYLIVPESCRCKWDDVTGICQFAYNVNETIGGAGFITCVKSFALSTCVGGKQYMNWTAKILPADMQGNATAQQQCAPGYKEIKCGTAISKMEFFDVINLIIAVAIIAAYYIFTLKKEAGRHHKARKR